MPILVVTLVICFCGTVVAGGGVGGEGAARLSYVTLGAADLARYGLRPADQAAPAVSAVRVIPVVNRFSSLGDDDLGTRAIPLPQADTLATGYFAAGRFGRVDTDTTTKLINPEILLVKFRKAQHVVALRVEPLQELDAMSVLRRRSDVEFVELDVWQKRQFQPNDPGITNQWHHAVLGSFQTWDRSLGQPFVRVAIVDTPFQMNHPDLVAQTDSGWDVVTGMPITASTGIDHSTLGAGLVAATIGNQIGGAGLVNCRILPININGAISEMYAAVIWAADQGVRVVNISWTGGDSETLNTAGAYLNNTARGVLVMAGGNGSGFLNYPNQPHIYCVAMTDAADNPRSRFGNHIDFAAPGWLVYSTSTNSGYGFASGTSFATPIVAGVVASLFSINPTLSSEAAMGLLQATAVDLGAPGWDQNFGWGRVNFAAAAAAADALRPAIISLQLTNGAAVVTVAHQPELAFALWKSPLWDLPAWGLVTNLVAATNGGVLSLIDPAPGEQGGFYRLEAWRPQ